MAVIAATALGMVVLPPATAPAAAAAAALVGNGITTTDLSAVGISPTALAAALVGGGVTVSNVTYSGALAQAGAIHVVDPAVVSFNDGIILSSGNIADVVGPNKSDGITGDMAGPADADLNALIQNTQTVNPVTFDAASLEFDFVPSASQVYFTYTFGSDEYLEWVNLFNDVFAFYVNGTNCATISGGAAVSIDTINSVVNPNLFRDNSFSSPPANPINIESDGLSVELICSAPVNAGQTNHMKLAIADTSDQILDSVVMIKAGSLSTTKPESCNDGVDNDDDTLVDMNDPSCTSTVTPPPTGSGGIGASNSAPPFTGNEGTPIQLDAAALGWTASPDTVSTSWTVHGINGTTGTCDITPSVPTAMNPDGSIAVATAICPNEGEYVARVDGWDSEGGSSYDTDVDFFVHNAPPSVTIDTPAAGAQLDIATPVDLSATITDPGINDVVSCEISWGDGVSESGAMSGGTCTGSHTYSGTGSQVVSVTGTDDAGDSAAGAILADVIPAVVPNTPPTAGAGGPYTGTEGTPVALAGSASDADSDPLTTEWTIVPISGDKAGTACVVADPAALSTTVTCNDNANFTATLSVDDGQALVSDDGALTIDNVVPTNVVTAPAPNATVLANSSMAMSATVGDVGSNDSLTCSVTWGDGGSNTGTVASGECTSSHTYIQSGPFTVSVTATDDDGGATMATRAINVVFPLPTIVSLNPLLGGVGTSVTINGSGFIGATAVKFNGKAATAFTVLSATSISATVPTGATTGTVSVTTPGGTATSSMRFTVVPAPTITRFSPTSGPVGTSVTITGTNFTGATEVRFNGTAATVFTVTSATRITAIVPAGASKGALSVTTAGGIAISTGQFTVTIPVPVISSFTPLSGAAGALVTIAGSGFSGASAVKFNGVAAAAFTVVSSTKITVVVPSGATSGKITVTTPGGTATSKKRFTVR